MHNPDGPYGRRMRDRRMAEHGTEDAHVVSCTYKETAQKKTGLIKIRVDDRRRVSG